MRKRFTLVVMALLIVSIFPVGAATLTSKSFEPPIQAFDRAAHLGTMIDLQKDLALDSADLAGIAPIEITVTPEERESISVTAETMQQKMRVGLTKEIHVPMGFARRNFNARAAAHGVFGGVRGRAEGGFRWAGAVRAPEAAGLRIHFVDFNLPEGAELYVYTKAGMAFGPYTGRGPNGNGDFWSNTVAGEEVVLQLDAAAGTAPSFTVAGVAYLTEAFRIAQNLTPVTNAANTKPCSFNADCTVDAACGTENAAVTTARNAVAHMLFASGGSWWICSGGLVADSDLTTSVPYFITANHCIATSGEAASLETFFFYVSSTCQGCPDPGAASTIGATFLSGSKTSDYTLMRLNQPAPVGAAFLGWSSTAIASTNNTPLYRLSHPKGSPQAYSEHRVDTARGTCRSWPRGSWIYSSDILGATEGGSSGSPVVDAQGRLVGQLSGGCGFNVGDVCDTAANATVDGAFAAYYTKVSSFLAGGGGGGTCIDADGDGVCATAGDCNDTNANIRPGANDTKGKQGRDGVDNDCDGVIDG